MFTQLAFAALLSLAWAMPTKRDANDLKCVNQQYTGPFTATGLNGYIHLYANITKYDSSTKTTSFTETRLGVNDYGTLGNCGKCQSTQQFGFEVCQGPDRKGNNGLGNSDAFFFGHILYTTDQTNIQCLQGTKPYNGSLITVADCQYDYENAAASGQYWKISISEEGGAITQLVSDDTADTYGVSPAIDSGSLLTLCDAPTGAPFTYLGFKAPEF